MQKREVSNFDYPDFSAFHQAMACLALERGWLRLYKLAVLDRAIAICYNFHFHDRIYAYAVAFDLDWYRYSPGRLAIANSIQASIREAAREYDWGAGDHAYKLAWTDQVREEHRILYSKKWSGRLWIEWLSMKEIIREFLITKARQWIPQSTRDRVNQFLSPRYKKTEEQ